MGRCCCCIGLRTGSVLVGLFFLVVDVAAAAWAALGLADHYNRVDINVWPRFLLVQFETETLFIALWVALGLAAAGIVCDLFLIGAAASRRRCGQVLWLVFRALVFTALTLALLVLLGLAVWLLVDASAADKLGLKPDNLSDLFKDAFSTDEQRQRRHRDTYIGLLVVAIVGLIVMAIFWGWFSAVDRNQRRLRHTTVIVKTQHMHTSRL